MAESFVHLHQHTEFSMLDGASRISEVVEAAAQDGQPALGITDHGNLYGALDFYSDCKAAGIKPVIGIELYQAKESRSERPARSSKSVDTLDGSEVGEKAFYHLTALAETTEGYWNLVKLSSEAFLSGFHFKPRVDWELLDRFHSGLIVTTGCLGGLVGQALLADRLDEAIRIAARLQDIFGKENLFVELQDHGLTQQQQATPGFLEVAKAIGAPLLATNDSHYVRRSDAATHDALLCVQTGARVSDEKRFRFEGTEHYLKTAAEMRELFAEFPEACDNSLLIAERANVDIEFGVPTLPPFPIPDGLRRRDRRGARGGLPAAPDARRSARSLRRPAPAEGHRAHRLRARRHQEHGLFDLLPRRVGPDPLCQRTGDPGRTGSWLGGGLLRRLLPRDREARPDPLRLAL